MIPSVVTRLARAEARTTRSRGIAVAAMVAAAIATLSVLSGAIAVLARGYDSLADRTHAADAWLYLDPTDAGREAAAALANRDAVAVAGRPHPEVGVQIVIAGRIDFQIARQWVVEPLAHPLVTSGQPPIADDEVALDTNVAAATGVGIGSTIEALTEQGRIALRVAATYVSAETCAFPFCGRQVMLTARSPDELRLAPVAERTRSLAVPIVLRDGAELDDVIDAVPREVLQRTNDRPTTARLSRLALALPFVMTASTGAVALLALLALLGVAARLWSRGAADRLQVATALGVGAGEVRAATLLVAAGWAVGGAITGAVVAPLAAAPVLRQLAAPFGRIAVPPVIATPAVASIVLAATVAVLAIASRHAIGTAATSRSIRPLRRPALGARFTVAVVVARSVVRSRQALVLPAVAVVLAATMTTAAAGLSSTVAAAIEKPSLGLVPDADLVVRRAPFVERSSVQDWLSTEPSVVSYWSEGSSEATVSDERVPLRYVGEHGLGHAVLLDGRHPNRAGEALVGIAAARSLGVTIGDDVEATTTDGTVRVRIVGTVRDGTSLGRALLVDDSLRPGPDGEPYLYLVKTRPGTDLDALRRRLERRGGHLIDAFEARDNPVIDSLRRVVSGARLLAVVLLLAATTAVFVAMLLFVSEARRDLVLVHTLGIRWRAIGLALLGLVVLAATGAATAAQPAAVAALQTVTDVLTSRLGLGSLPVSVPRPVAARVVGIVAVVAAAGGVWPAATASRATVDLQADV